MMVGVIDRLRGKKMVEITVNNEVKPENAVPISGCNCTKEVKPKETHVVYDAATGIPDRYSYDCERCLKSIATNHYDEEDVKELFDYEQITGHKLCPQCREEFEKLKSKSYRVEIKRKYQTKMGEMVDNSVEYLTKEQVEPYLDRKYREIDERLAMECLLRDNMIRVEYVPYGERINIP